MPEAEDAAALIQRIGVPVFLLGHSYGAHVALGAARILPDRVRTLVLYEASWPRLVDDAASMPLEALARAGDWEHFAARFFTGVLAVPPADLEAVRASGDPAPIVADAPASLGDLRALARYRFNPESCLGLPMPVLLQVGSESPPDLVREPGGLSCRAVDNTRTAGLICRLSGRSRSCTEPGVPACQTPLR